jgi:hypothetical protein
MAMSDEALLHGFVTAELPVEQFHHEQHVRVAWMFVRDHGMPAALDKFSRAIKRFADAKGKHGLYHETITWAFLLIIAERLAGKPADTWDAFAADNADLLSWKPSILERYYSKELLASAQARTTFVMPDLLR